MPNTQPAPLWRVFDAAWYRTTYKTVLGSALTLPDAALKLWYDTQGAYSGHSPNRYFDEEWYRLNCAEAFEGITNRLYRSGFEHYCQRGFKTQAPHYLFSERYYMQHTPELTPTTLATQGYVNGYDHYLRTGDHNNRSGHVFFNPALYLRNRPKLVELEHLPPFQHLLHMSRTLPDRIALSEQFDPLWYGTLNPEALRTVQAGYSPNMLFSFLSRFTPNAF